MQKIGRSKFFYQSGQALVLILLSLSVALTVVLYILSRSVTDIFTSSQQADSVRAFSAAEAGVEKALITGANEENGQIGDATYSVEVVKGSIGSDFNYPPAMLSGETFTLWFMSHDVDGNLICNDPDYPCFHGDTLKICWGNAGTPPGEDATPAIEVSIYYKDPGSGDFSTVKIGRAAFDPYTTRTPSNFFSARDPGTCTIGETSYVFQKLITLSDLSIPDNVRHTAGGLIFAKIRMIYNTGEAHQVGASVPGGSLPSQGLQIYSTGTAGTPGSQSNSRVSFFQSWPEFPLSGMAIFYPSGIVK
jgi:hypothetical protein